MKRHVDAGVSIRIGYLIAEVKGMHANTSVMKKEVELFKCY